jgi:hypothetical protein
MRSVVRTRPRGSVYAEHGPTPVVRLDGDADRPVTFFVGQPPRGGADPSSNSLQIMSLPPPMKPSAIGLTARVRQGSVGVFCFGMLAVYVVEHAVEGLGYYQQASILALVGRASSSVAIRASHTTPMLWVW